jgi:hypothetical protein
VALIFSLMEQGQEKGNSIGLEEGMFVQQSVLKINSHMALLFLPLVETAPG